MDLYPPCIIYRMRQSCYIHPTIIELYIWKEIYLVKENLCITTGVLVCFSLGRGDIPWLGGPKIYIPPSVIYLLFSYLINMEGWIYHDWYIESEIIYVTPWKLFLNTSKKIQAMDLYPPCIIYQMRQSCYIHPTIIELYRWKKTHLEGLLFCSSLTQSLSHLFHSWRHLLLLLQRTTYSIAFFQ